MKLLIKLGGTLLESAETRRALCGQIAAAQRADNHVVVVHGGGKRLSRYLQEQGFESEFRHGFRVTPPAILDAVLRIFAGSVNHNLVAELVRAGAKAVGLSGVDAGLVSASQLSVDLGAVGRVDTVDPALLELLTAGGYLPAVACIAGGAPGSTDAGAIYNVNADQMAAACAGGFQADQLIYLTDVSGVLDAEQRPIARLSVEDASKLIDQGVARGGMEAKLRAAISALKQGADEIRIAAGAEPDALTRLLRGEPLGTAMARGA